jgi:hypothetical protein
MTTGDFLLAVALFAAGYAASIFTWPWIRKKFLGADAEIQRLSARIGRIMNAIRDA